MNAHAATVSHLDEPAIPYRELFEANPQPMWLYDQETLRFLMVNQAAVDQYGWSREAFLGMTLGDIRPPDDVPQLLDRAVRRAREGLDRAGVWRHLTRDGRVLHVDVMTHSLTVDGRPARLALVRDVSTDVEAERQMAALLAAERRARHDAEVARAASRAIFESAPGSFVVLRPRGYQIAKVSDAFLRATGAVREEIVGRCLFEVFPDDPDDPTADGTSRLRTSIDHVVASGRADAMPVTRHPIRRPGGGFEERWWSPVNSPVLGPDGQVVFVIHRVEDVTPYVRAHGRQGERAHLERMASDLFLRAREVDRQYRDLRRAFDGAAVGLLITAPDGRFEYANPAFLAAVGYDFPRLQAMDEDSLTHPEDRDRDRALWQELLEGARDGFVVEKRYVRANATVAWVRNSVSALVGSEGPRRVVIVSEDVTSKHEAEARLRESEERFRHIACVTSDTIWDWDLRTEALWWNHGAREVAGITPDAMPRGGIARADRVHPEDRERVVDGLRRAIDDGLESWTHEYRLQRDDGSYAVVEDSCTLIRDELGAPIRVVGGTRDRTEQRAAEGRMAEQASLLDKAQDAILVRDMDGRITFWNASATRMYGWSAEEALGRTVCGLLPGDVGAFEAAMARVLETGEWTGEADHVRKDGSTLQVESHWTLVRDDGGRPHRILAIHTDVTEKKKLLANFLRAQRMQGLGTLAGGIAHDLNNVLTPILMCIDTLKREVGGDARETLDAIEASAARGADMVRQILYFARGVGPQRVPVDIRRRVEELVDVLRDTFPRQIAIETGIAPDVLPVRGDPTQIHQVLLNLCVNARDAMPDGGTLQVRVANTWVDASLAALHPGASAGPHVIVTVTDTGVGMTESTLEQMFDPFFTTKELGHGTGLGLATVAAIIDAHAGFVQVQSELGRGVMFEIYLPASESARVEPKRPQAPPLRGSGEQILVVDDEPTIRSATRRTLEASGYRVLCARHGAEAVAIYTERQGEIDAVVMDVMMPVMDGPEAIRALRGTDPNVRVVAVSGLQGPEPIDQASSAPLICLTKPYSSATLLDALRRALA